MKLFDRDYNSLTADEEAEWHSLQVKEVVGKLAGKPVIKSRFREYPKAARHFTSIFPNNYLDIVELNDEQRLNEELDRFRELLDDPQVNERMILNFINNREAYFIVASVLKNHYSFGHHDAYLFREFPLGTSYKVDYVLVGKSSDGWSFVFAELEAPNQGATLADGDLGLPFRKGLKQIANWDTWLDAHFSSLAEVFHRCRRDNEPLPDEFLALDKSRIHFLVVAGRRSDFLDKTYRTRRKKLRDNAQLLLHYDNLVDAAQGIIGGLTY
jgi:hypothetical protein